MAAWLKQSTSVTIQLGPFVDKTDGVTYEIGLATAMDDATTGIRLSKNGAVFADRGDATAPVYDAFGFYRVVLSATDTGTLGNLIVQYGDAATCLPVWKEYMVVPANVWDSMFGADLLQVDLIQVGGDAQSGTDLKDFADAGYDPATNKVQGVVLVDTLTTNSDKTGYALSATGLDAISQTATGMVEIAKAVWDRVLNAANHNIGSSAGKRLRTIGAQALLDGTASAGTADTITLVGGVAQDRAYSNCLVAITDGTGAGQARFITHYNGTTKVASVMRNWVVNPDATSVFVVLAHDEVVFTRMNIAQAGGANTITLDTGASATNDLFNGQTIRILGGTGDRQVRTITDYDGTTKIATVSPAWQTIPDATSIFGTLMHGPSSVDINNDKTGYGLSSAAVQAIWDALTSALTTVGSIGKKLADWVIGTTQTADVATLVTTVGAAGAGLTAIPWNAAWDAEVESEANDALVANHLDHLLAVDYDPAAKPGVATALLNEIIGNDLGVSQFTANALELAPTGDSAVQIRQEIDANSTQLAAILADTGTDGVVLSAAQMNKVADHVIRRNQATARASASGDAVTHRSLLGQLSKVNNLLDAASSPGNILVYAEDDTTLFVTIPITTDAAAAPITVINPPA